jgi:hypothetical protein
MAIKKQIAFEGLTYNLDDRDRVAMKGATQDTKDGAHFKYSEGTYGPSDLIIGAGGSDDGTVDPFTESSTQLFPFGTKLIYGDRAFRYAGIGSGAVTAGKTLQSAAATAHHRNQAVMTTTTAGDKSIDVVFGATAAAANLYAEGYVHINDGTGQGQLARIKSHDAVDSAGTGSFALYDTLQTACTFDTTFADLIIAPYNDLVVGPTTQTGPIIGVTVTDMTADYYGWVQTGGPCSILYTLNPTASAPALALGDRLIVNDTVAGSVMADDDGDTITSNDIRHQILGTCMVVNDTTDYIVIWLTIDS